MPQGDTIAASCSERFVVTELGDDPVRFPFMVRPAVLHLDPDGDSLLDEWSKIALRVVVIILFAAAFGGVIGLLSAHLTLHH